MEFFPKSAIDSISARHWKCHSRGRRGDGDVTVRAVGTSSLALPPVRLPAPASAAHFGQVLYLATTQSTKEPLDSVYTSYKCPSRPSKTNQLGAFLLCAVCTFPSLAVPLHDQRRFASCLNTSANSFIAQLHRLHTNKNFVALNQVLRKHITKTG